MEGREADIPQMPVMTVPTETATMVEVCITGPIWSTLLLWFFPVLLAGKSSKNLVDA